MFRKRDIALSASIAGVWTAGQRFAHYQLLKNDPEYKASQAPKKKDPSQKVIMKSKYNLRSNRKYGKGTYHKKSRNFAPRYNGGAGVVTNNVMGAVLQGKRKRVGKAFKRWKKFKSKVLKATNDDLAIQSRVIQQRLLVGTAFDTQNYFAMQLGSLGGDSTLSYNVVSDADDLSQLMQRAVNPSTGSALAGEAVDIVNQYLDCEITNCASGTVTTPVPVVLDVYKVVCRRDEGTSATGSVPNTLAKAYINGFNNQGVVDVIGAPVIDAAVSYTQIGTSPYESRQFTRRWKIISRRRILLNPQCSVSLSLNNKRRFRVTQDMASTRGPMKGVTMGLLFVWSSCVNTQNLSSNTIQNPPNALAFESIRTYKYRVIENNLDAAVYQAGN